MDWRRAWLLCFGLVLWGCSDPEHAEDESETVKLNCGNGELDEGEKCDDGNKESGDGCSKSCKVESGWVCENVGQSCEQQGVCGDGILGAGEKCDDGNKKSGDGCTKSCKIESGWTCLTPGEPCTPIVCGNSLVERGESCDDGNSTDHDGCSSKCILERGWSCLTPGEPCSRIECGNGIVETGETCDDGNEKDGDGCSASCTVEKGWVCPEAAKACKLEHGCGNGTVETGETCDDGNLDDGDGCSASCFVENGWRCPTQGEPCTREPGCGNGVLENDEQCDDQNLNDDDGCSASCEVELDWECLEQGKPCTPIPTLRLLSIGNSFSIDSTWYLYSILSSLGYRQIVLGNLYDGGGALWQHAKYLSEGTKSYTYYENRTGSWAQQDNVSGLTPLDKKWGKKSWDFISIQQNSQLSGVTASYATNNGSDDLSKIIEIIKEHSPSSQIIWNMTWSFQQGSTRSPYVYYGWTPSIHYNTTVHSVQSMVKNHPEVAGVIPTATAIENLRTGYIGDNLTRDGYRLSRNNGRIVAALMWARQLSGGSIDGVTATDLQNNADLKNETLTDRQLQAMKIAVENAYQNPYRVTPLTDGYAQNNDKSDLRNAFKNAGYDLDKYDELDFTTIPKAYYQSTRSTECPSENDPSQRLYVTGLDGQCTSSIVTAETGSTASDLDHFVATRIFSRDEIPTGSVIVLKTGFQYRPEGWISLSTPNSVQPENVTDQIVKVDDAWWGDYRFRALNISQISGERLSDEAIEQARTAIDIFVPKSGRSADIALAKSQYDPSQYEKLELNLTHHGYWKADVAFDIPNGDTDYVNHAFPTKFYSDADDASQYMATRIFSRDELPVGSLIVVTDGYQYRPEGWKSLEEAVESRPSVETTASSDSIVFVNESWWGAYQYRAFNISKVGASNLDENGQNAMRDKFAIYRPISP